MKKLDEEIVRLLKEIVDHFDKEDRAVRERQILTWRQLKFLWDGFSQVYYSEIAHDWRIPPAQETGDQSYYDKPVNVFRAYLESIIAALAITVPPITCYPDDADNPLDLVTAKAGDKIGELIYRHNDIILVWLHALFIYCTEGMVAGHTYGKEDEKYGTYEEKKYDNVEEEHEYVTCPDCGFEFSDRTVTPSTTLEGSTPPIEEGEEDIPYDMMGGEELCPICTQMVNPEIRRETLSITRLVGTTEHPKSRQHIEVYGGLCVKIPNYARRQEECPYLIYSYETHYANAMEKYENYHGGKGARDTYESWGRLSTQYKGDYPENTVTCREVWLRPSSFNILKEEDADTLRKKFKNGARVDLVNDDCVDYSSSSLDDYWTLTYNPLSDYIHHDPIGLLLTSIQEITNDLISLTLQTIEHGIPQTFADPSFLDFEAYKKTEALPGGIFPTKPQAGGRDIRQGFHEIKTATLSPEVLPFGQEIQQMGQLTSGALPSLFGGQLQGTGTASEYSMSRAQALQRLQNVWKMFTIWWKTIFSKVIPAYIKNVKDDERDVKKDQNGNFINVFIRKAELEGKIGRIELEANENLPLTWSQTKDVVMQLLQGANPQILQIIGSPENLPVIRKAIGLTNFFVPGEDDRQKQYEEIKLLLNSEPIMGEDGQEMPSVEVDPDTDNHGLEAQITRSWLISDAGRLAKTDNPTGYRNILLHLKMHNFFMQQQMAPASEPGEAPAEKPNELEKQAPIMEEEDVSATV